jgi:hypothetical protein
VQECEGKAGVDTVVGRAFCFISMAERMHGIHG